MQSDLPQPAKVLFSLVYANANTNGRAILTTTDLCAALDIGAANLRRYRASLAAADICDSTARSGEVVFIINPYLWVQGGENAQEMRESRTTCAERAPDARNAQEMRESRTTCAERAPDARLEDAPVEQEERAPDARNAQEMRETRTTCAPADPPHTPPKKIDRLIDVKLINNQSINPGAPARGRPAPTLPADPDLTADQIAASLALLETAGVPMPKRAEIAAGLKPELVYRHYADWWVKFNAGRVGVGALAHQASRPDWNPPPLTDAVRQSSEYRAFLRAAYPPDPDPDAAAEDPPEPIHAPRMHGDWEPWPVILSQLRLQMTKSTFDTHLRDTIADAEGDQVVVRTPNKYSVDWLDLRLRKVLERTAQSIVKRDLTFKFAFMGADQ
jgi:hypothetical protein